MPIPVYYTGDTWPPLPGICKDAAGAAVDISTSTSRRAVAKRVGGTEIIAGAAVFRPVLRGGTNDGTDGKWEYVWGASDLSVAGDYCPELEVTWSAGKVETFRDDAQVFTLKADND